MVNDMDKRTIFYRVIDHCEDSYYPLETNWDIEEDPDYIAQDAADDYVSGHDGWESDWPLTIALHDTEGGREISRMIVDMEHEPTFTARPAEI